MSLILDAINRSQRERAAPGEVPGVATVHYAEATVAPRAWRQGLLGLLLVIAVGVIAWLLLRPAPVAEPPVPDVAPPQRVAPIAESAPQPVSAPSPRAMDSAPPAGDTAPAVAPEVAALYEGEVSGDDPAPEPQSAPAPASRETAPSGEAAGQKPSADAVTAQAMPESAAPEQETSEEALDVEALLRAAQREMASEALSEHPAPFLSTLSQQRKDAIPTLLYSAHDYRGDGNSTVLINGKTARAGQGLGKGVSVVEILPDSVVLAFEGKQFRLRALNSWVNL